MIIAHVCRRKCWNLPVPEAEGWAGEAHRHCGKTPRVLSDIQTASQHKHTHSKRTNTWIYTCNRTKTKSLDRLCCNKTQRAGIKHDCVPREKSNESGRIHRVTRASAAACAQTTHKRHVNHVGVFIHNQRRVIMSIWVWWHVDYLLGMHDIVTKLFVYALHI